MPITYFPPAIIESGDGSSDWGNIGGNIDEQYDLFALLSAKSDITHNHAGVYEPANSKLLKQLSISANNCENTDAEMSLLEVTIPGDSMQDGDAIILNYALETYQNNGSDNDLTLRKKTDNNTFLSQTSTFYSNLSVGNNAFTERLIRRGNKLLSFSAVDSIVMLNYIFSYSALDNDNMGGESAVQDFSADIVYKMTAQWSAAHANSFIRVLAASAFNCGGVS